MNWQVRIKNLGQSSRTQKTQKSSIGQSKMDFSRYVNTSAVSQLMHH